MLSKLFQAFAIAKSTALLALLLSSSNVVVGNNTSSLGLVKTGIKA
jgi:hypothetical protein